MSNQNPKQIARDKIDSQLIDCGWIIQDKKKFNLAAGLGVAIREYQTHIGTADYVLFVDRKAVGIIEAKREEEAVRLTTVEEQSSQYANAKLRLLNNDLCLLFMKVQEPLPDSLIIETRNHDLEMFLRFIGRKRFNNGQKKLKH